jgi:D-alanyl-D-alanine carboxypeptidase
MAVRRIGRAVGALLIAWIALSPLVAVTALAAPPETDSGTQAQILGDPLVPGTTAIVIGDGDCLRLRDAPSLTSNRIDCIPDGRTVLVLPSTHEADGFRWQLIEWHGQAGWAADEFLAPYDGPPETSACSPSAIRPGISGGVPSQGGFGLVVWGGGKLEGLQTAALAQECTLTSVWANRPSGGLVGYRFGAPVFVNREWSDLISATVANGTPLLVVCERPGFAVSATSIPLPLPSGVAPVLSGSAAAPQPEASAAVVIDEASGAILYEHNAHLPLAPASLTKIVTAILALEGSVAQAWVQVTDVDYRQMPGSSVMGLIPGDCFTVSDLLYGLMLPSGNDAALAIARHQAGSDEAFVAQMNALVRRLGLTDSTFTDPHGLGSNQHRTSAYDIAMLSRYAMTQLPEFRTIVAERSWTAVGDRNLSMFNVNSFLTQATGADGVKTGFTEEAGRTLSASATRDGHRLYAVILNDDNRNADATALLDWAFANYSWE